MLAGSFIGQAAETYGLGIVPELEIEALRKLEEYPWPGNVRELQYAIERAAILCDSDIITENEFASILIPALISPESLSSAAPSSAQQKQIVPLETLIEDSLRHALEVTEGNIIEVARGLKIGRATVYRLMEKYQIKK